MKRKFKPGDRIEIKTGADRGRTGTILGPRGSGVEVRLDPAPARTSRTLVLMPGSIRKVVTHEHQ